MDDVWLSLTYIPINAWKGDHFFFLSSKDTFFKKRKKMKPGRFQDTEIKEE